MSLERFLELLGNKNTLINPSKWDDPFEKLVYESSILKYGESNNNRSGSDTRTTTIPFAPESKETKLNGKKWYGQCWSLANESDALWRVFTHSTTQRSVKVSTTYGKLRNSYEGVEEGIAKFFIDKVEYPKPLTNGYGNTLIEWVNKYNKELSDIQQRIELSLLLTKRKIFEHEKEVRFLAYIEDEALSHNCHDGLYSYDIEASKLIQEVELDPWMPKYTKELVACIAKCHGLEVKECKLYQEISKDGGILFDLCDNIKVDIQVGKHTKTYSFERDGKIVDMLDKSNKKHLAKVKLND